MNAIGHAYQAAVPSAQVLYMSAERFMFEFVSALRARDTHAFKARLRSADLLMIDDLQFIAGKGSTQEEFFHTINEIVLNGKRLVICADRAPQALDAIEPRIVSRLSAGWSPISRRPTWRCAARSWTAKWPTCRTRSCRSR